MQERRLYSFRGALISITEARIDRDNRCRYPRNHETSALKLVECAKAILSRGGKIWRSVTHGSSEQGKDDLSQKDVGGGFGGALVAHTSLCTL
jgi:hypothetical protein